MADADFSVKAIISAQTSQFEKGMKNAQSSVNSMSKSIEKVQKLLTSAFSVAGITMGVKAITDFGKTCVQAATQASKQFNILDNTVKATGADAWTSTKELDNMAKSLSSSTNYSVSEIEKMQSVLLGFRNITNETFEDASEAVMDMATVMGMDLTSAVQTVGKALDDPIKGLDSLRRQGFAFTDEQKSELELLVKSGKQIEAQKIILDELASSYGGAAKAGQDAFAQQRHAAENFTETVGGELLPVMQFFAKSNANLLDNLSSFISNLDFSQLIKFFEEVQKLFSGVGEGIFEFLSNINNIDDYIYEILNSIYKRIQFFIKEITAIAHGDWDIVWEYMKLGVLMTADEILTSISLIMNSFPKMVNSMINKLNELVGVVNKIREFFGQDPIGLIGAFEGIDLSEKTGITEQIEKINETIRNKSKKSADYVIHDLERVDKKTKETGEKAKKNLVDPIKNTSTYFDSFRKGVHKALNDIGKDYINLSTDTEKFNKLIETMGSIMTNQVIASFQTFFTSLGEQLVEGELSWKSMTAVILDSISQTLAALGSELTALAAVSLVTDQYHKAAIAAAGAAAAFTASGAISAIANKMKETAKEAANIVSSMSKLQQKLNEIKENATFDSMYDDLNKMITLLEAAERKEFETGFAYELSKSLSEVFHNYNNSSKEVKKALKAYEAAQAEVEAIKNSIQEYYSTTYDNLKKVNEEIQNQVQYYKDLYSVANDWLFVRNPYFGGIEWIWDIVTIEDSASKYKLLVQQQTNDIKESILSVYSDFANIGATIGENLVDGIIDGTTKKDFAAQLKSYMRENMIKLAVYTDEFSEKLGEASTNLLIAMNTKSTSLLSTTRKELEDLWDSAKERASEVENFINGVFGDIQDNVEDVIDSVEEMGSSIADSLINGLSNGLSQADFLETMKSYIKKLVVTSVVYTESLQAEIAAIGEAISKGIAEGFTDMGLHEIRRDLSYIFNQANNAVSSVDSILSSVFTGYATGTDNATAGLHLVGEAGPELVRFKGGEQVYNAQQTAQMLNGGMGGNNFNITFQNMQDTSAYAILQQMKQWQREMAINGII